MLGKIINRTAKICVVGLGYVGLPLAMSFAEEGFVVTGYDIDMSKVDTVNLKTKQLFDKKHRLRSLDIEAVGNIRRRSFDIYCVCVPTPINSDRSPDLSFLRGAMIDISAGLRNGAMVVIESTSYPGTAEDMAIAYLRGNPGEDYYMVSAPERINPGE